jgi:hypothetical protein
VVVLVVCLNVADAVDTDVAVRLTLGGIYVARPVAVKSETKAALKSAATALSELVLDSTELTDHGKLPPKSPDA